MIFSFWGKNRILIQFFLIFLKKSWISAEKTQFLCNFRWFQWLFSNITLLLHWNVKKIPIFVQIVWNFNGNSDFHIKNSPINPYFRSKFVAFCTLVPPYSGRRTRSPGFTVNATSSPFSLRSPAPAETTVASRTWNIRKLGGNCFNLSENSLISDKNWTKTRERVGRENR